VEFEFEVENVEGLCCQNYKVGLKLCCVSVVVVADRFVLGAVYVAAVAGSSGYTRFGCFSSLVFGCVRVVAADRLLVLDSDSDNLCFGYFLASNLIAGSVCIVVGSSGYTCFGCVRVVAADRLVLDSDSDNLCFGYFLASNLIAGSVCIVVDRFVSGSSDYSSVGCFLACSNLIPSSVGNIAVVVGFDHHCSSFGCVLD